jgi:hypothetical protein
MVSKIRSHFTSGFTYGFLVAIFASACPVGRCFCCVDFMFDFYLCLGDDPFKLVGLRAPTVSITCAQANLPIPSRSNSGCGARSQTYCCYCKPDCVNLTAQKAEVDPQTLVLVVKVAKYMLDAWLSLLTLSMTMPLVPPVASP